MKSKLLTIIIVLSAITFLPSAFAADWTPFGFVTRVYAGYDNGQVYVRGLKNTANCKSDLVLFRNDWSDTDKIETLAMAAFLSGKKFKCAVEGCYGSYQKGMRCFIE